jgi:Epoxide hydrolase N terminus.
MMEATLNTTGDPEAIRPFEINVPGAVLDDLRNRLATTRLPDQIPGTAWDYGTNRAYLSELLDYWEHDFDWRAQEQMLNAFDQYKTTIDGLDVHFISSKITS